MKRNLLMNSQLSDGKTSPILIWMQIVNLIFYDQISQFITPHVPRGKLSKYEIKLSSKPCITKEILAKKQYRDTVYSQVQPDPNLVDFSLQETQE